MIPHRTRRGKIALDRLKVFEGVPPPYDKLKRVCVPSAMKILCLRTDRKVSETSESRLNIQILTVCFVYL